jgi:TonB family protein
MKDENTHESEPQRNVHRMNSVPRHLLMLIAITLLAASSPNVLGQSTQQAPAKPQLGMGVTILTPTEGVDFSHYIEPSMKAIKQNWIASLPEAAKTGTTGILVIRAQIQRDGTFLNDTPHIERSSRRDSLDKAAIAAVRASAPFPNFPSAFQGSNIELRIQFYYNIPVRLPNPEPVQVQPDATPSK